MGYNVHASMYIHVSFMKNTWGQWLVNVFNCMLSSFMCFYSNRCSITICIHFYSHRSMAKSRGFIKHILLPNSSFLSHMVHDYMLISQYEYHVVSCDGTMNDLFCMVAISFVRGPFANRSRKTSCKSHRYMITFHIKARDIITPSYRNPFFSLWLN